VLFDSRITIFVGHFGSGKTEIAVNSAISLARRGDEVALVDLDIVKPYFRSRSARDEVTAEGVKLVAPEGEHFYADLPIIVPQVRDITRQSRGKVIMDAGGDDTGARVLGSLADVVKPAEISHLLVLNFRRPFTETVDAALKMLEEIEASSRLRVTGFVANTHLMGETTLDLVQGGLDLARETARRADRPIVAVAALESLAPALEATRPGVPVITLTRRIKPAFGAEPLRPRIIGPVFALR
jgi:hypothetical protein